MTTRTLTFRRTEYDGKTDQLSQVGKNWLDGISLCGFAVDKLWDLPAGTTKVWVTATTERPEHGDFYRLRPQTVYGIMGTYTDYTSKYGLTVKVKEYLTKWFRGMPTLYIVVEYEDV